MAELESQMRSASLSERNGAVALCIGSSQHPYKREGVSTSGVDLRSKRRYRAALRGDEGLTDILKDVQTFKKVLEHLPDVEVLRPFVGKAGSGALTRGLFLNKMLNLVSHSDKEIFLLYYAGHGLRGSSLRSPEEVGAFYMEDTAPVTFADMMKIWEARPGRKRRQRLIIVADSCHSGGLVEQLKNVPKRERDVLNVGIQAACLANEFSEGGIFTEVFAQKQLKRKNFMWQKLKAAHKGQEVQYPTFYCTWGGTSASSGDFEFHFFKRPTR
ncbi:hypothetical protein CYMTET_38171 [Cymbomonas tetramitiformis]|uniref:Peptidase C14 caspase domain-containing protein n=1 Tax=Cymbomonas tetramitiformis TaxID=36881 RepID=A0AAE0CCH3_9CHLO|nr:hypothetical protein CYMTET_38171 [Cymbomonas tetramitiformis]